MKVVNITSSNGRQSDGSVYNNSHLGYEIENNTLNLPEPKSICQNPDSILVYVFIADDAFGLKRHMMKPHANQNIPLDQRIFNYRLSRRIIENTLGIATTRFRIFRRPIIAKTENVILITKAVVALHNFLMRKCTNVNENNYSYCPQSYTDKDTSSGGHHLVIGEN